MSNRRKVLELFEAQAPEWEKRAKEGIEQNRKGNATLLFTDKDGNPLSNARVRVVQKSHAFRFGANLFMLDELETPEKNEAYKSAFAQVFNMATLPFYWDSLEPERGAPRYAKDSIKVYRRPSPDLCVEFCEKHGIEPREHALAYDQFFPAWLREASVAEVKQELERRYAEIAARYADKIPTIEVTNEMGWEKGKTAFYDEPDYVPYCLALAEKYFPKNILAVNESTDIWMATCRPTDKYYAYIDANLAKGVRIDAVGMQYHLFNRREDEYALTRKTLNPERLYRNMDLYARFGKPLQITEVTLPAYSWEAEDEALQAEMLEKLYTVWFSHPAVTQIVYWNLVDGYAHLWDPDPAKIKASQGDMTLGENYYHGGLLRFDLSPKPAYERLKDLITKKWHTEETLVTDSEGRASFRGFYGAYEIEAIANGKSAKATLELSAKNESKETVVSV